MARDSNLARSAASLNKGFFRTIGARVPRAAHRALLSGVVALLPEEHPVDMDPVGSTTAQPATEAYNCRGLWPAPTDL